MSFIVQCSSRRCPIHWLGRESVRHFSSRVLPLPKSSARAVLVQEEVPKWDAGGAGVLSWPQSPRVLVHEYDFVALERLSAPRILLPAVLQSGRWHHYSRGAVTLVIL